MKNIKLYNICTLIIISLSIISCASKLTQKSVSSNVHIEPVSMEVQDQKSSDYDKNTFDVLSLVSRLTFDVTESDRNCIFTIVEPAYQSSNTHLLRNNSIYGNMLCKDNDYFAALIIDLSKKTTFSIEMMDSDYNADEFELKIVGESEAIIENNVNSQNIFGIISMNAMHYFAYNDHNICHFVPKIIVQDETSLAIVQDETSLAHEGDINGYISCKSAKENVRFPAFIQIYSDQPYRYQIFSEGRVIYNSENPIGPMDESRIELNVTRSK